MDRKLASVQKIVNIEPIPSADLIEKATVLGWEIVIGKKDNFKVGDLVVYIETDSIVPERPEYEFLRDRKFRVRTIKLKKQISQGLVLPLSVLGNQYDTWHKVVEYQEGDDVTALIGVRKYDPEGDAEQKLIDEKVSRSKSKLTKFLSKYPWYRRIFMTKKSRGGFPKFIHKTDEDRIQLFPHICENEKDTIFSVTEKIDGQSGTWFLVKNHNRFLWFGEKYIFGVCSRNLYLPKPNNSSYWTVAKKYGILLFFLSPKFFRVVPFFFMYELRADDILQFRLRDVLLFQKSFLLRAALHDMSKKMEILNSEPATNASCN